MGVAFDDFYVGKTDGEWRRLTVDSRSRASPLNEQFHPDWFSRTSLPTMN